MGVTPEGTREGKQDKDSGEERSVRSWGVEEGEESEREEGYEKGRQSREGRRG